MGELLTQEDIDRMLNGAGDAATEPEAPELLRPEEIDALGEIGNICMGTSATTLSTLLGQKVSITTPKVTVLSGEELQKEYLIPYIAILIEFKVGVSGTNLMVLKPEDVKIITSLMMGMNGVIDPDEQINEIHLSAIGEAMNQMIGSAATSLSDMFSKKVDISPPVTFVIDFQSDNERIKSIGLANDVVRIAFQMQVGDLIQSEIMQIMPIDFAKELTGILFGGMQSSPVESSQPPAEQKKETPKEAPPAIAQPQRVEVYDSAPQTARQVNVIQPRYETFDTDSSNQPFEGGSDMFMDIPVDLSVELGKVRKQLKDLMKIGAGSLIPLNKVIGEPVNVYANGKCIGKGEVVVVDDSYAVRVTELYKNK